jgi:hypothetical protein
MNIKRLETLAEFLETDPVVNTKGKFHLQMWMAPYKTFLETIIDEEADSKNDPILPKLKKLMKENEGKPSHDFKKNRPIHCRTTACALGWAASIPSFRRAGFKLLMQRSVDGEVQYILHYKGEKYFSAACEFFDIILNDAYLLFSPDHYKLKDRSNPKIVAKHIRQFIKEQTAETTSKSA